MNKLIVQTALGAGKMLKESGKTPEELRNNVTSKGGTTEAALKVFEKRGFKELVEEAIEAAYKRAKELSGE